MKAFWEVSEMRRSLRGTVVAAAAACLVTGGALTAGPTQAATPTTAGQSPGTPANDPFYTYDGATPLGDLPAGRILKTRTVDYHVSGVKTPVQATQIAFRTSDAQERSTTPPAPTSSRP